MVERIRELMLNVGASDEVASTKEVFSIIAEGLEDSPKSTYRWIDAAKFIRQLAEEDSE
ncbi:MAG: hypothetical protein IIC79_00005 [Chloroflexi bacterium]|nr:hypothetical protein [Chloroflexota bacterium]